MKAQQPKSDLNRSLALVQALQNEQATHALIDLVFHYCVDQKFESWLDLEIAFETLQSLYHPELAKRLFREWLPKLSKGFQAFEIKDQGLTVNDWLTSELDAELRALCMGLTLLNPERIETWVKHPLAQQLTQEFVEETLQRFIQRLKPNAEGGGLLSLASRGALGWAAKAGRGALGGFGEQIQEQLNGLSREFISASMPVLLERLSSILSHPELATRLAQAQVSAYENFRDQTFQTHFSRLTQMIDDQKDKLSSTTTPLDEWVEILSEWLSHILEQEALAEWVGQIHQDVLNELGEMTPRQLVDDETSLESLRHSLKSIMTPLITEFAQSGALDSWCSSYLKEN